MAKVVERTVIFEQTIFPEQYAARRIGEIAKVTGTDPETVDKEAGREYKRLKRKILRRCARELREARDEPPLRNE